jgi:hypothetical protein
MPSGTLTRPVAAQAEKLCSPQHRLARDRRSHRPLSLGSSSPVGTARPRRCPRCSSQAAVGSPPSGKSRNTCGAPPLNPHPVVCWLRPAGVLCLPSEDVLVRQCSVQPCRDRRPIPRPLSATLGRHHPGIGALSQDHSCRSAAKISVTGKVGRLSMGMESSYSILWSGARPAPKKSSRYFRSSR